MIKENTESWIKKHPKIQVTDDSYDILNHMIIGENRR